MNFETSFGQHLRAGCAGIWVTTREAPETQRVIRRVCEGQGTQVFSWDADVGFRQVLDDGPTADGQKMPPAQAPKALLGNLGSSRAVILLHGFHDFIKAPDVKQGLVNAIYVGKSVGATFVVLSAFQALPEELQTYFAVLRHEPPSHEEITRIVNGTLGREADAPLQRATLEALSGLSRFETEQELSLCLAREEPVTPRALWNAKARSLEKGGFLKLYRGTETFKDVKGLAHLKEFSLRAFRERRRRPAKGLCLVGVSGAGKSLFAHALGNEVGRVAVTLKIGSLLGSLVGQSEQNLRTVLDQVESMAPVVLFLDEIEKDLQGNSQGNDSGVMSRIFGTLLTWRQDTTADVYMVATANNVASIPYEFLRPGRFDATFFIDLPSAEERVAILEHHIRRAELAPEDEVATDAVEVAGKLNLEGWTGAEIEQLCYLVAEMGYSWEEAAERVPVNIKRAPDAIQRVREFASGWALSASSPGLYYHRPAVTYGAAPRRAVFNNHAAGTSEL